MPLRYCRTCGFAETEVQPPRVLCPHCDGLMWPLLGEDDDDGRPTEVSELR